MWCHTAFACAFGETRRGGGATSERRRKEMPKPNPLGERSVSAHVPCWLQRSPRETPARPVKGKRPESVLYPLFWNHVEFPKLQRPRVQTPIAHICGMRTTNEGEVSDGTPLRPLIGGDRSTPRKHYRTNIDFKGADLFSSRAHADVKTRTTLHARRS